MGGVEPALPVPITSVVKSPPWEELPVIRHGAGGARTDIVCGFLHSEDLLFDPGLRAFPPALVVQPPPGPARSWFDASITYALEAPASRPPSGPSTKLPELLLVEILRLYLARAPAAERGWLVALHDPVLAKAMVAIHRTPERRWTLADLAAEATVSRSLLGARFRETLGRSPIRYLTEWRMHVAQELLSTSDHTVAFIARGVGVKGQQDLRGGGHENCAVVATGSARPRPPDLIRWSGASPPCRWWLGRGERCRRGWRRGGRGA